MFGTSLRAGIPIITGLTAGFAVFSRAVLITAGERRGAARESTLVVTLLRTGLGVFVPVVPGLTTCFIPEAGAFFISAGVRTWAAGEGAEIRTGLAVVILGGSA